MLTYFRLIFPLLFSCHVFWAQANPLINYGNNDQIWLNKLRALAQGEAVKFRILQLGDSHTAADFFSNASRKLLQNELGNGGIGWVYPNKVRYQNDETVNYDDYKSWQVSTSHRDAGSFPLGGVIAKASNNNALTISPKDETANSPSVIMVSSLAPFQGAKLTVKDGYGRTADLIADTNDWSYTYIKGIPPISFQSQNMAPWTLGPISIENNFPGIIYSSMGLNGAQLSEVNKWRSNWLDDLKRTQADLVILSYGTNEAFNQPFRHTATRQTWQKIISEIKQTLPNAGILIIGAPESLKTASGICGTPPAGLHSMQEIQQQLALENGLLYWSWQEMMGGECSMKTWIHKKIGRKDGIHFTVDGYEIAGNELGKAIIQIAHEK